MKNNSHKTAIIRKKPSAPLRELIKKNLIKKSDKVLDFGCGRETDVQWLIVNLYNAKGYDPYWKPTTASLDNKYDVVLCTYVLNVVGQEERTKIIKQLKDLTNDHGKVYITVRRDLDHDYVTSRGTHQYVVKLPFNIIKETSSYCIYELNDD